MRRLMLYRAYLLLWVFLLCVGVQGQSVVMDADTAVVTDADTAVVKSDIDKITFYTSQTGTFDARIDFNSSTGFIMYGDGQSDRISGSGSNNISHNYTKAGTKTIKIYLDGGYEDLDGQLQINLNNLEGTIPSELENLSNLIRLYLHYNNLEGTIPPELGNLSNLNYLYLNDNNLEGTIPSELGNLSNLNYLFLHYNNLEGTIPSELENLSNLNYLYLFNNNLDSIARMPVINWTNGVDVRIQDNTSITANNISLFLQDLDASGIINGYLNISGCNGGSMTYSDLDAAGQTAYDNLETNGWTITTD